MKQSSLVSIFFLLLFSSCGDEPSITNENLLPSYTGRRVLVEQFTNVRFLNCISGHKEIDRLVGQYEDYIIPVSIYSYSEPYEESLYDFFNAEARFLGQDYLSPIRGYPTATINRQFFLGEHTRAVMLPSYQQHILSELLEQPKVGVNIQNNYDAVSRLLTVKVDLNFLATVTDSLGISVMILEDNIVDYQLTENGKDANYVHNHVLRKILTGFTGDVITANQTTIGQKPQFTYTFNVPTEWNAQNCSVVAFVSEQKHSLEVLQANKAAF
jgi:hypothetical protein